jgi:hypothetical protein
MGSIPLTATIAMDQRKAMASARAQMNQVNHGTTTIETQDTDKEAGYVIYVYNIIEREYTVSQPPLFPGFIIPACPKGHKFSFTLLPAFVKETYLKPGSTEYYYKNVDGRKCATSLLNPSAYPGTNWNSQIQKWDTLDQTGNNLNKFGVWWSLTKPDETEKLEKEIKIFKKIVGATMQELVNDGEKLSAAGDLKSITPLMHFAMDYFGKQAKWHMSSEHMVSCPNCGEMVKEGVAYHKNDFGDRCIIDPERYAKIVDAGKAAQVAVNAKSSEAEQVEATPKKRKKAAA